MHIRIDNRNDLRFIINNAGPFVLQLLKERTFDSFIELHAYINMEHFISIHNLRKLINLFEVYRFIKIENNGSKIKIIRIIGSANVGYRLNSIKFDNEELFLNSEPTKSFPNTPVNPLELSKVVSKKLEEYKQIIPKLTSKMVQEICKSFNQCIKYNKTKNQKPEPLINDMSTDDERNKNIYHTLVLSPRTGSAKSLTLKAYVSMLKQESSIIVLKHVDDMYKFCKDVNEWADDEDYARCHFAISDTYLKNKYYANKSELCKYRCIVITHNMYKQIKRQENVHQFKIYGDKPRNLVVIDEKINTCIQYSIEYSELDHALDILLMARDYYEKNKLKIIQQQNDNHEELKFATKLTDCIFIFRSIFKGIINRYNSAHKNYVFNDEWDLYGFDDYNLDEFIRIIHCLMDKKYSIESHILGSKMKKLIEDEKRNIVRIVTSIVFIVKNTSVIEKLGNTFKLHAIDNVENNFLSLVNLDATAHVNAYYALASHSICKNLKHVEITNPKRYNNLTFHLAYGYSQGRSSIYKSLDKDVIHEAQRYLQIAESIICNNDQLLIVGHKDFIRHLEVYSESKQIFFTNWGRHIGKNDWANCNKIMVIGWNYLKKIEHYFTLGSSSNGFYNPYENANTFTRPKKNVIQTIANTQIADDLIQAVSRGSLRNTINTDGDCPKTDIYLFHKKNILSDNVLDIVLNEFTGANLNVWIPNDPGGKKRLTKVKQKEDAIIALINQTLKIHKTINTSFIGSSLNLPKSTTHRIIGRDSFKKLYEEHNLQYVQIDKKSKGFIKI